MRRSGEARHLRSMKLFQQASVELIEEHRADIHMTARIPTKARFDRLLAQLPALPNGDPIAHRQGRAGAEYELPRDGRRAWYRPMRHSLLLSIILALTIASPALASGKWFHSPSGNISCEVTSGGELGTKAFCQSEQKPRSVTLNKQGTLKVCHGTNCLGDGPEDAFELGYGKSVTVGNFKCTSKKTGMRCSVSPSGRGFELSGDALDRF